MSVISRKFNAKIASLKNEFEVNKDIKHQGIKGGFNEIELSNLITDVIPQRYQVTKGIIENSSGEQSNETDILIYDNEILPLYMKNDLTFVPVEAVKYNFEVKSSLNATEVKTTIDKFKKFRSIGGKSPTVLFGFSSDMKGSELARLKTYDADFYTNPSIDVICTSGKSYYYKDVTTLFLKDFANVSDFLAASKSNNGLDIEGSVEAMRTLMSNDEALSQMSRSQFAVAIQGMIQMNNHMASINDKELVINGNKLSEITFKIHRWIGVEAVNNEAELGFLSGISNTLSKGNFGQYLLSDATHEYKVFSVCYENMWGNLSFQDFNENGLDYDSSKASYSFRTTQESHQIIFSKVTEEKDG
ncbi:TPA: hypothetical protein RQK21_004189 [Vibrio vulnificus]|nr:hypothetical protein [Vibrio vulnificus]HDY7781845.1 hypothetical protein [Vibrio vulnificus]